MLHDDDDDDIAGRGDGGGAMDKVEFGIISGRRKTMWGAENRHRAGKKREKNIISSSTISVSHNPIGLCSLSKHSF